MTTIDVHISFVFRRGLIPSDDALSQAKLMLINLFITEIDIHDIRLIYF